MKLDASIETVPALPWPTLQKEVIAIQGDDPFFTLHFIAGPNYLEEQACNWSYW